jgi:hypothetical protein
MKAYGRSEIRAPLILHLSTRWRLVELNALVVVTPRKRSQYPLNDRLGVLQSHLDMFWKTNVLFPPAAMY